jgi:hypothetical protein
MLRSYTSYRNQSSAYKEEKMYTREEEDRTAVQASTPRGAALREEEPVKAFSGGVGGDLSLLWVFA